MTTTKTRTPLRPGIYCPTLTFFHPQTEDLHILAIKTQSIRLARAGLVGLVTLGSSGEAVHLPRSKKALVTRATRDALDEAGFPNVPIVCGAGEQSVRGNPRLVSRGRGGRDRIRAISITELSSAGDG